jgi:hypothetical protein
MCTLLPRVEVLPQPALTPNPLSSVSQMLMLNGSVDQRFVMSQAIRDYVLGKDNVVVLGDFNEFEFTFRVSTS